jgi:FKBP-type peptidyl-prolyl cis-trans isomerase
MFSSSRAFALVAGLFLPGQQSEPWKPFFDYTHLPPTDEEYWQPLGQAQVVLQGALELVAKSEGATVRPLKAWLEPGAEGAGWRLELVVGDADGAKRLNLLVSAAEPKVLRRLELRALAPDEEQKWSALSEARVTATEAIEIAIKASLGDRAEPLSRDQRVRTLAFRTDDRRPVWEVELMYREVKNENLRRFRIQVDAQNAVAKERVLLDRFAGEPLRKDKPVELENGMFLFDFVHGDGQAVTADSKVKVNYRLFLLDNTKIHDTWKSRLPETFVISQAPLRGMTEGMIGMRVGGKRKIAMPYDLAFGEAGNEIAPPKAMIVCDVSIDELVSE